MIPYELWSGDCLEEMNRIEDGSVDAIIADLPYGTTACKWDSVIPLDSLWNQFHRVVKPFSAIVLFASQPFTTTLISSNVKEFKYSWVWEKPQGTNFLNAPYQPLKTHEDICVFSDGPASYSPRGAMSYYPQMGEGKAYTTNPDKDGLHEYHTSPTYSASEIKKNITTRYPRSVIKFSWERGLHATQKPIPLMDYLVLTYTRKGELVLDCTMGSGSTGEACVRMGRRFIGIEKDPDIFLIAKNRIDVAYASL
jgi:DNA modification methylase